MGQGTRCIRSFRRCLCGRRVSLAGGPVSETDLMDYGGLRLREVRWLEGRGRGDLICRGRGRAIREVGRGNLVYG